MRPMRTLRCATGALAMLFGAAACIQRADPPRTSDSASSPSGPGASSGTDSHVARADSLRRARIAQEGATAILPGDSVDTTGRGASLRALLRPRPTVSLISIDGPGVSDTAQARRYVTSREPQLRFCYSEYGLKSDSSLRGELTIELVADTSRRAERIGIVARGAGWRGQVAPGVEACLIDRVRGWRFGPHVVSGRPIRMRWGFLPPSQ